MKCILDRKVDVGGQGAVFAGRASVGQSCCYPPILRTICEAGISFTAGLEIDKLFFMGGVAPLLTARTLLSLSV